MSHVNRAAKGRMTMSWLIEFTALWIASGAIILLGGGYAAEKISARWPNWWRQYIVDDDPSYSGF